MNIRRKLPPLAALTAFEAAARVRSFTKAAAELGVTQAAVSRQIHLMEETLGFPLFRRLHRSIELTDKGQVLSTAATSAFNLMADTIAELTREEDEGALSISATLAISHFWLMPKIASFSRLYPDSRLRIVSQDSAAGLGGSDFAIRYGNGAWPDGRAEYLFDDELFPVCSPEYAAKLGSAPTLEDIARQPLISYDSQNPSWIGWEEWLAAFSIKLAKAPSGLRTSFYTEAVYAALSGQGIALGWKRLLQNLLDTRSLIRLTEQSIVTRDGYFLIVPPRSANNTKALQFIEWLKTEAAD